MSKKNNADRVRLIANPGSGTVSGRGELLEKVTLILKKMGMKVDVAVAKPKEKTIPIAKKAIKDGYKVIIGMGGDDTIEAIIRGIGTSKVRFGMIPVGTANNLAKGLGIPSDVEQACAIIAKGKTRKLDLGKLKMRKGKSLIFFELVTVGIAAAIYPSAIQVHKGRFGKIKDTIKATLTHAPHPKVTLKMEGGSDITVETMLTIVSNVPLIGPNMNVDPDASSDDGLFDISMYPNFSKAELLAYSTKVMNEKPTKDGKIQRYRSRKMKIKSSPKLQVMADGINLGKGSVKIKVLPGALRVFAPKVGTGVEKPPSEASLELPSPVATTTGEDKPHSNGVPDKEAVKI